MIYGLLPEPSTYHYRVDKYTCIQNSDRNWLLDILLRGLFFASDPVRFFLPRAFGRSPWKKEKEAGRKPLLPPRQRTLDFSVNRRRSSRCRGCRLSTGFRPYQERHPGEHSGAGQLGLESPGNHLSSEFPELGTFPTIAKLSDRLISESTPASLLLGSGGLPGHPQGFNVHRISLDPECP